MGFTISAPLLLLHNICSRKVPEGKSSHALLLSGVFRGGHEVLVRAKLALSDGVAMQLTVR